MSLIDRLALAFPFLNNATHRHTWIKKHLTNLPRNQSILDAGAGECPYKKYCQHLQYVSQDLCQYDGIGDATGLQTRSWDTSKIDLVSDITHIPVNAKYFDNILCTEVLEHVPYPDQVIREFSRVLKDGGRLILTAPFCSLTHFAPYHFCTGFNIYWYKEVLKKYNMKIIIIERNGNYFDYLCQELVRLPLVIQKYTSLSYLGYILYLLVLPAVLFIFSLSKLNRKSEEQLCFGYHIVAQKLPKRHSFL